MIRRKLSKGYELTSNLARGFLKYLDTLSDLPYGNYVVLGLGTFLVFLKRMYQA